MKIFKLFLVVFSLFLNVELVRAAEDLQIKKQYSEKARARSYDGGVDEQPLVVQPNLSEPRTDGSEYASQKKILNSDDGDSADESNPSDTSSTDETNSGF